MSGIGLLKKANLLQSEGLAFFDFIAVNKIKYCAFLCCNSLHYFVSTSYGLNAETILKFVSTVDFWNGTISDCNKVHNFFSRDNSINPFLQFFSENLRDNLNCISILKLNNNQIFILCNQTINNKILTDIKSIDFSDENIRNKKSVFIQDITVSKYEIKFTDFIKRYINKNNKNQELTANLIKSINKEIQLQLKYAFNDYSHINLLDNYNFELYLQTKEKLPTLLIQEHIVSILNDIIPVSKQDISITEA